MLKPFQTAIGNGLLEDEDRSAVQFRNVNTGRTPAQSRWTASSTLIERPRTCPVSSKRAGGSGKGILAECSYHFAI
jgi:hypothetical protein